LNAHAFTDLSRRDDLASWFDAHVDSLIGGLPWKGIRHNLDVAVMKNHFSVHEAVHEFSPRLSDIWLHISALRFESDPDYEFIIDKLDEIMRANKIEEEDECDWEISGNAGD
jgi:casein kinase 1